MSVFARLAKWKLRFALVSGAFTLVILPILRLLFKRKPASRSGSKQSGDVIDVAAHEVEVRSGRDPS